VRVLAFRHGPSDGLGRIADVLGAHDIRYDYADLSDPPAADHHDADALIVLGGSMSANDDLPTIHREIECIRAAANLGKAVLGVCLGAQLIAKALGARVYANPIQEIGWAPVTFTKAAQQDALFHHLDSEMIFHWHRETFDLPAGAEWLAWSPACRHQAFRVGDRVDGLQFHLEVTPAMISQWCIEDAAGGSAREVKAPIDAHAHSARLVDLARKVFGRWCTLARKQVSLGHASP